VSAAERVHAQRVAYQAFAHMATLTPNKAYVLDVHKRIGICGARSYNAKGNPLVGHKDYLFIVAVTPEDVKAMNVAEMFYGLSRTNGRVRFFQTTNPKALGYLNMNDRAMVEATIADTPFAASALTDADVPIYTRYNYDNNSVTTSADGYLQNTQSWDTYKILRQYYGRIGKPAMFALMVNNAHQLEYGI
jgi:hypothetical protein